MIIRTKAVGCSEQNCGSNRNEKPVSDKKTKSLIVRTSIKAGQHDCGPYQCGTNSPNHNEKLANDNSRSIEQKKGIGKNLRLS